MKRSLTAALSAIALLFCLQSTSVAQNKTADFSGTWVLDKTKTTDLPPTLESYTMNAAQDAQQLTVETQLKGEVGRRGMGRGAGGGQGGGRGGGGFPGGGGGGRGGGGGFPGGGGGAGGGGGFPGGGGGGGGAGGGGGGFSMPKDMVMAMALQMGQMGIPQATYNLDGKETVVQLESRPSGEGQPPQPAGSVMLKASWKKGGKLLELQSTRKIKSQEGERSLTSKDRWEMSEDGKTLTVKRSIETPMGAEEAKLVFSKQ